METSRAVIGILPVALFLSFAAAPVRALAQEATGEPGRASETDSLADDSARATARGFTVGAETAVSSGYAWRGITITDRPVFEPSAWASLGGLNVHAWGQVGAGDADRSAQINLSYALTFRRLRVEPGVTWFANGSSADLPDSNTVEGFLSLSFRATPLRVFWSHAFDVSAHKGSTFGGAGFAVEDTLAGTTTISLALYGGWASSTFNEVYVGLDRSAFNVFGVEGSITWMVGSFYIEPRWSFSDITDRELRAYLDQPSILTAGIGIGFEL